MRRTDVSPESEPLSAIPTKTHKYTTLVLIAFLAILIGGAYSSWLYENYYGGDLHHYENFWRTVQNIPFEEVTRYQRRMLGGGEPFYGFLVYFSGEIAGRFLVLTIINIILVAEILFLLGKVKSNVIVYPLILTNYYLIVLLGPAERLKVAVVMLLAYFIIKSRFRYAFLLGSIGFHLQMFAAAGISVALEYLSGTREGRWPNFVRQLSYVAVATGIAGAFFVLHEAISRKMDSYLVSDPTESFESLALAAFALLVLDKKRQTLILFSPFILMAALLGGARVNMMVYILYFVIAFRQNRETHPLSIILLLYGSIKSILFIRNIAEFGVGFQ